METLRPDSDKEAATLDLISFDVAFLFKTSPEVHRRHYFTTCKITVGLLSLLSSRLFDVKAEFDHAARHRGCFEVIAVRDFLLLLLLLFFLLFFLSKKKPPPKFPLETDNVAPPCCLDLGHCLTRLFLHRGSTSRVSTLCTRPRRP